MNPERHEELFARWLDGTLDAAGMAGLNALLRESAEARARFGSLARLDSALRDWAGASSASESSWAQAAAQRPRLVLRHPMVWLAAAASVAILLSLAAFFAGGRRASHLHSVAAAQEETNLGCAILTRVLDASFNAASATPIVGDTLNAGPLKLDSGLAQIEFFSGATVVVEGAASLELVSPWELRCESGKLRVRVPPPAHGFRVLTPDLRLVDLGTEFGVDVNAATRKAEVHVFEGEVEAHPTRGAQANLATGQGIEQRDGNLTPLPAVAPGSFVGLDQMDSLQAQRQRQRLNEWWVWSREMRKDPRLIAYYPFRHHSDWERLVNNAAEPVVPSRHGGAVGAAWTAGRWPGKDALEFKRPGDRVRLAIDGTYDALTLACWVKVDGLDRRYSALLLTDGYDPGEPHWQIYEDGRLMFSINYAPGDMSRKQRGPMNQIYYSPVLFNRSNAGRWHHIAVAYDNASGEAVQYFDGQPVSREISRLHQPGRPLSFGPCEIGNWGLPTEGHYFPVRNLNGAIDEFAIYGAKLTDAEIRSFYEAGKPR